MKLACVHTFTISADTLEEGRKTLADLGHKIDRASAALEIGYEPGFISGQRQPDRTEERPSQ